MAIFQESRNIVFLVLFFWLCCFFFFCFVFLGFSWIGFAGIWRFASFLSYTTVEFTSLIELSIFRNFYYSWQLMPNLVLGFGVVLFVCLVLFLSFGYGGVLFFWLWSCLSLLCLVFFFPLAFVFGFEYLGWGSLILGLKPEAP